MRREIETRSAHQPERARGDEDTSRAQDFARVLMATDPILRLGGAE
jgi:hypothetical protein